MPYRNVSINVQWLHLNAASVWTKNVLQDLIELHLAHCLGSANLLDVYLATTQEAVNQGAGDEILALANHVYHHYQDHVNNMNYLTDLHVLDTVLHDIPPEEEVLPKVFAAPRHLRIDDLSDIEARNMTRFNVDELRTLFRLFGFEQYAAQFDNTPDMMIPIPTGNYRGNTPCRYLIHAEEVFIFMLTKVALGWQNVWLINFYFGGHASKWSYAYPWAIKYIDERYASTLGFAGLQRFVNKFPEFNRAIEKECQRTKKRQLVEPDENGNDWVFIPGLKHLPFDVIGFIDDSIDRCSTPMSGPRGDYEGAARKAEYQATQQQAFYTGYKKLHGIKVEEIHLPNGISFVFGPVSARHNDVGVLQMSNIDNYLAAIQDGMFTVATANGPRSVQYSVLGDSAYSIGLSCVQS